jgi:tRNA-splicing ligase RtcB (3'-phosphate/5'-hydroxy nucleic acid ligase)
MNQRDYVERDREKIVVRRGYLEGMQSDCHIYVPEEYAGDVFSETGDSVLNQVARIAQIPGICHPPVALPDIHMGKEFPVGVAYAVDPEDKEAALLPESIGHDIHCGVRFWRTNIDKAAFMRVREDVMNALASAVPIVDGLPFLQKINMDRVLEDGLEYLQEIGLLGGRDIGETAGKIQGGDRKSMGQKPKSRGLGQLGTLGTGNHYLEIQEVDVIYDEELCREMGLKAGGICLSVHCGSRGLGHKACSEYLDSVLQGMHKMPEDIFIMGDKIAVRAGSEWGRMYITLVNSAGNYALCNRALIGKSVEQVFQRHLPSPEMCVVQDIAHNFVAKENHGGRSLLVSRKGSTGTRDGKRSLYPIVIGGSMDTASYVLVEGDRADRTLFSTCHGAGRVLSRGEARRKIPRDETVARIREAGVSFRAGEQISEESGLAYKDIDSVVQYCEKEGISRRVCRLRPLAVLKG